jgi:DNA polymerase-3 subunit beta
VLLDRDNDELVGVATDGRRLAVTRVTAPLAAAAKERGPSVLTTIVPGKALRAIQRVLPDSGEATLAVYENHIVVVAAGVRLYSRLVEGKFPKWRDVLPSTDGCRTIDLPAAVLLSAVRQAAIVATQESKGMEFTFSDGTLEVSCDTAEVGKSHVELPIVGQDGVEPITITLDHTFVAEFLKVAGDSGIAMHIRDGDSAVLFELDGYKYVVMPLSRD